MKAKAARLISEPGGILSRSQPTAASRALLGISGRVLGNRAHVLGALEGAGVGAVLLAQAALELSDGFVFVFFHPGDEVTLDDTDLPDAVPDERGAEHGDVGPGHEHLKKIGRAH